MGIAPDRGAGPVETVHYGHNEPCAVLQGWRRRDGVLRQVSAGGVLVAGIGGLRVGDAVTVVLTARVALSLQARVETVSIHGAHLRPDAVAGTQDWHRIFFEVARRLAAAPGEPFPDANKY